MNDWPITIFESVYKILRPFIEFSIAYTCFSIAYTCFSMLESGDRPSQCEIWAVIKYLNKEQVDAREIHWRLCAMYREDNAMVVHNMYRWVELLNDRRMSTHNDVRDGRPSNNVNDETVNVARTLLDEDRSYKQESSP